MYRITFALDALGDPDLALREIGVLLEALTRADQVYLQAHPEVLRRRARLEHVAEPQGEKTPGQEDWQDVPTLLRPKANGTLTGSDRDLACLQAAALRLKGHDVTPEVIARQNRGRLEFAVRGPGQDAPLMFRPLGTERYPTRTRFTFVLGLFDGDRERELSNRILQILLDGLTEIDVLLLQRRPDLPTISESDVRYVEEPPMQEDWQDWATCLRMKRMDCDDGGCARAAEHIVRRGVPARAVWRAKKLRKGNDTFYLYHITTELPDGRREDPSWEKGMR